MSVAPSILITAGPTHEPIDAVRYLANRSSGRMGVALAHEAAARSWKTTLLLGPVASPPPPDSNFDTLRFRTCADLQALLAIHAPKHDVLVMAAAVADYRPKLDPAHASSKFRRVDQPLTLDLEPTPDLLAGVAASKRPDQFMVGFALEPRADIERSSRAKLERKKVDLVVGNPLETMDAPTIDATIFHKDGRVGSPGRVMHKPEFAAWLLDAIASELAPQRT
jgi:phosphopantothenoylcysteine decarboxylase/phosphopantothenate--cysteine ligase